MFRPMRWTAKVVKRVLANGVTLLVQRDDSAPVVAVVTHVKAGYFDEPDEWQGIAHVLEHMFFKGTVRRGPGDVARDTQVLGGYLNAATIYDKTVYYVVLPSAGNGLEKALDVQSDALMHTALDADALARELEVIIQEAKRKLDTPPAVARETLYELLFSVHRMRRWRIGTEAGLRKLVARDLRAYYATRYTPDRVIVGMVGDLNVDRALRLADAMYGEWQRSPAAITGSPAEPDGVSPSVRVLTGDVTRPLATVGWRTVGALHADAPALDVAACVLGSGRGSRLYRTVRMPGLASSAHASHYTPTEVGVFDLAVESEQARLDEAVARSAELVAQLIRRGPVDEELERAYSLTAARWARHFESMDGRAAALCEAEALGGYELADDLYHRTMSVSARDVRRVAEQYLDLGRACAVFYLPNGATTRMANGGWPLIPADIPVPGLRLSRVSTAVERENGTFGEETVHHEGGIVRRSLAGMDMLARSKRGAGLVSIVLNVAGLRERETSENAGISQLLVRSALRGAGGMNGEELAQATEVLGGGIVLSTSVDGLGWALTVRSEALRDAAELLRLVALEPALLGEQLSVERVLQASDARRLSDDMFRYPIQRVLAAAYADDAYGLPLMGDPETIEAVADAQVRVWGELLRCHRATVVAVGDLEAEEILAALEPLASWSVDGGDQSTLAASPAFTSEQGCESRDKEQSALAMAFPAMAFSSPDRHALMVVGTVLSGLAGRLFDELREKRSLAYTVAAMPWLRARAGAMLTYIATSPERENEAREAMLAELRRLGEEAVSDSELQRARNYAAGLVEIRQQSGASVAGEILEAWNNGVLDDLPSTAERLRRVSADDVASVARQVFAGGVRAEYVVRGRGR